MSWQRDIRIKFGDQCWDVSEGGSKAEISLFGCHGLQGNQLWKYDRVSLIKESFKTVVINYNFQFSFFVIQNNNHIILENSKRCLDVDFDEKKVFVSKCDVNRINQKWNFGYANATALDNWRLSGAKLVP